VDTLSILKNIWDFILLWYWIPLLIIDIAVIILIVSDNVNPPKALAWLLVVIFLPVAGIILYFFFGQKFKTDKRFQKFEKTQRKQILEKWDQLTQILKKDFLEIENHIDDLSEVYKYLNNTYTAPPTIRNEVKLLINGEEKFPEVLKALQQAERHIHLEYYIFEEDEIGKTILEILENKAKNGVEVRVILDDLGSSRLNKKIKKYAESGIQFQIMLPVHFNSLANSNYRDHRKILIVDGEIAFVGGINISDKYINTNKNNKIYWRDTSVMIRGEAINILQVRFWQSWIMAKGKFYQFKPEEYFYKKTIKPKEETYVSFAFTSPGNKIQSALESLILAVYLAKRKVQLCTPYFIPTDTFKTALMVAASKGVEIELMIPNKGDSAVVQNASLSFLKPLLRRNVKVYLYEKGFIHAKTVNIDNQLAFIGTVNLDTRSFLINMEINAVIHNRTLLQQLDEQFEKDKKVSTMMTLERWEKTSIFKRAFASVCRLLAPLL